MLEGAEAAQDVLPLRRVSHGADAPDLPLECPNAAPISMSKSSMSRRPNAKLVDAFRHEPRG